MERGPAIATNPPTDVAPQNRLSIAHLMIWTFGSALILGCYRALVESTDSTTEAAAANRRLLLIYQLGLSPLLGAQVGSLFLLLQRRFTGRPYFPAQPGHWLLVVEGISVILMWAGYGLGQVLKLQNPQDFPLLLAMQVPNYAVSLVGYLLAVSQNRHQGRGWLLMFIGLALQYGLLLPLVTLIGLLGVPGVISFSLTSTLLSLFTSVVPGLLALGLVIIALIDPHRQQRDFLHWTGVVCLVGMTALLIALRFGFRVLSG